jgi:hypothetical protein
MVDMPIMCFEIELTLARTWFNAVGNREFYMSCSPVKLIGDSTATQANTSEYPLLIANLQADPQVFPENDWAWSSCHTIAGTWIRYPERNRGLNQPIQAAPPPDGSAIKFTNFTDSSGTCGSDNADLVGALGQSAVSQTASASTASPSRTSSWEGTTTFVLV